MSIILYPLLLLSAIATIDIFYFHIWKCRLHDNFDSRWEVLSHAGHGFSSALLFFQCLFEAHGKWALIVFSISFFQIINQTIDTMIEPASRRNIGGIPEGEYKMHGVINFIWGIIIAGSLWTAWIDYGYSDSIRWITSELVLWQKIAATAGAICASSFALYDLSAFLKHVLIKNQKVNSF